MRETHVYSPYSYHGDSYIVSNREGLESLRDTIDKVLNGDESAAMMGSFTHDGEGFYLAVCLQEDEEVWHRLPLPYTGVAMIQQCI